MSNKNQDTGSLRIQELAEYVVYHLSQQFQYQNVKRILVSSDRIGK